VTEFTDTGRQLFHYYVFEIDNNRQRRMRQLSSTDLVYESFRRHRYILMARMNWEHHGRLPDYATRVDAGPTMTVVPFRRPPAAFVKLRRE
jgi:hypothetical protein